MTMTKNNSYVVTYRLHDSANEDTIIEVIRWVAHNCKREWRYHMNPAPDRGNMVFFFSKRRDAALFRLMYDSVVLLPDEER